MNDPHLKRGGRPIWGEPSKKWERTKVRALRAVEGEENNNNNKNIATKRWCAAALNNGADEQ